MSTSTKKMVFQALSVTMLSVVATISQTAIAQTSTQAVSSSDLDPKGGFFGTGVIVDASSESSKVKGIVKVPLKDDYLSNSNLAFSIETALNKESERTDLVTNFDLNGEFSAGVSFTRAFSNFTLPKVTQNDTRLALAWDEARETCLLDKTASQKDECEFEQKDLIRPENLKYFAVTERQFVLDYNVDTSAFLKSKFTFVGAEAKLGRDTQQFRNSSDFRIMKQNETPYGVSAYYGIISNAAGDSRRSHFFGLNHEVEYKAADDRTLCQPMIEDTPVECFTSAFEAPKKKKSTSVYGLTRFQTKIGSSPIGVEVKLAYDLSDNDFGIEVPIYLTADKDGNLVSGIRFRYDEGDDEDFGVGFFVGQKFDLFGTGG